MDDRYERTGMTHDAEHAALDAQRAEQTARWADVSLDDTLGAYAMWYAPLTPAELRDRQREDEDAIRAQDARWERV